MTFKFNIKIYGTIVYIIISKDIKSARNKLNKFFGPSPQYDFAALCSYSDDGIFAIFINDTLLEENGIISHEIFHLTHRILDYIGSGFDVNNQEPAAYLCEYITNKVYDAIRKYKNNLTSS